MAFNLNKTYTNHLSLLVDAVGHENMMKVKTALRLAGYTIWKGDPAETIARLEAENRKLRAEVSRSSYHCD